MTTMVNGKAVKFRTVAEKRVSRALKTIRRLGNLSRRGTYEYSQEQVTEMFQALRAELDEAELKFQPPAQASFRFQAEHIPI